MLLLPASAPRLSLPSESPAPVSRRDPTVARIPPWPRRGGQPRRRFSSSPLPGRQTGGRAGAGEPAQPRRGGGRRRKGRARSRLQAAPHGAEDSARRRVCDTKPRAQSPPLPPPSTARGSPLGPGRAGPPRPLTSGRSRAAPSCRLRPAPPRQPPRGRTGAAGRPLPPPAALTGAFRGAGGGESRRGTHSPAGELCPGPSRRVPREAVRRQPGPERPLRREEPRSARCPPRLLGLALPAATPGPAARLGPATSWPPAPRPCRDCTDFPRQPRERLLAHSSSAVATDVTSYLQKLIVKIAALPRR